MSKLIFIGKVNDPFAYSFGTIDSLIRRTGFSGPRLCRGETSNSRDKVLNGIRSHLLPSTLRKILYFLAI